MAKMKTVSAYSTNMLGVTRCPNCNGHEYVGLLHWRDGKQYCRHCISAIWKKDGARAYEFENYFPIYSDGKNYVEYEEDKPAFTVMVGGVGAGKKLLVKEIEKAMAEAMDESKNGKCSQCGGPLGGNPYDGYYCSQCQTRDL